MLDNAPQEATSLGASRLGYTPSLSNEKAVAAVTFNLHSALDVATPDSGWPHPSLDGSTRCKRVLALFALLETKTLYSLGQVIGRIILSSIGYT